MYIKRFILTCLIDYVYYKVYINIINRLCLLKGLFKKLKVGACMRLLLGACMRLLGACLWSGWVHVCGCWVQSIWKLLGACMRKLGASFITAEGLPDSR